MQLHEAILSAIQMAGGTQAILAERSGLSQQYISKLVRGKTVNLSLDAAARISRATDGRISLGDLAAALQSNVVEVAA